MRIVRGAGITTVYVTHDQTEALSLADHVVLLNRGRIEQADSPTRLYREPATVFAANFLGCSNILHGRVIERCGDHSLINCQGLDIYTMGTLIPGQEAKVMIRSGDIFINTQSQGPGTLLEAKVLQRSFQGVTWQYKVALEKVPDIQLEVWSTQEIEVTDTIQIWLPAEGCRVLREMSDDSEPAVNSSVSADKFSGIWTAEEGALLALIIVVILGLLIRGPLTKIPENTLKFSVGIMLVTFGTFWTGEGLGIQWPYLEGK